MRTTLRPGPFPAIPVPAIRLAFAGFLTLTAAAWAGPVELRSGGAGLQLDPTNGAIARLAGGGAVPWQGGATVTPFRLTVIPPGGDRAKPIELSAREAGAVRIEESASGVVFRYERIGGLDLAAVCSVEPAEAGFFRFRIRVEGGAGVVVERVIHPILPIGAPIEGDGAGDRLVLGTTKGGVFERPHQWKPGHSVSANQPGSLAAQFGCAYGPRGGLVTWSEDPAGHPKSLAATRTGEGLALAWARPLLHDLASPLDTAFPVVAGVFAGADGAAADWRDAAALYKAWALAQPWCARTFDRREDLPAWLRDGPAQVRFSRDWLARPERIEGWLDGYWKKHFAGVPLIVTFWGWEGVGTWAPPDYFPPHPSEEGFKRCVDAVRRVGGHVFLWPSGYQWCLTYSKRPDGAFEWDGRERFQREAAPHAIVRRDGSFLTANSRWYLGGEAATLCRGDAWTRAWFASIAEGSARRGAEMFQIDQVVGAAMYGGGDCRATTHGHPPGPGLWDTQAAHRQMEELHAAARKAGGSLVLGFEEPQELFLQAVGIQDYRDYEVVGKPRAPGHSPESVFGHLYHEFVPLFQSNPRATDRDMTAHCIVSGQMPHLVPHWPVEPAELFDQGGFEEWGGDAPAGWDRVDGWQDRVYAGRPVRDTEVRHGGGASLRIEHATNGIITQVSRNVPVGPGGLAPGRRYRIAAWLRTGSLARPAAIGIAALGDNLKSHGSWKLPFPAPGEWQEVSAEIEPAADAKVVRIMIHVEGACRVWVDDVRLLEILADGATRPPMRDGLPPQHDLYRRWVALYHGEGRPFLQMGVSLPPPAADPPGRLALGAFRAPDGREAVIAVNASDAPHAAALRRAGFERRVEFGPWEVKLIPGLRRGSARPDNP
jgi:hypothetical protein